jgi:hypothetical protein
LVTKHAIDDSPFKAIVASSRALVRKIKYSGVLKRSFKKFVEQALSTVAVVAYVDIEQLPGTGSFVG